MQSADSARVGRSQATRAPCRVRLITFNSQIIRLIRAGVPSMSLKHALSSQSWPSSVADCGGRGTRHTRYKADRICCHHAVPSCNIISCNAMLHPAITVNMAISSRVACT